VREASPKRIQSQANQTYRVYWLLWNPRMLMPRQVLRGRRADAVTDGE
jgi:hypothetical protein